MSEEAATPTDTAMTTAAAATTMTEAGSNDCKKRKAGTDTTRNDERKRRKVGNATVYTESRDLVTLAMRALGECSTCTRCRSCAGTAPTAQDRGTVLPLEVLVRETLCEGLLHSPERTIAMGWHWVSSMMGAMSRGAASGTAPPRDEERMAFLIYDVLTLGTDFALQHHRGRGRFALFVYLHGVRTASYLAIPCDVLGTRATARMYRLAAVEGSRCTFRTRYEDVARRSLVATGFELNHVVADIVDDDRFRRASVWAIAAAYSLWRVCDAVAFRPHGRGEEGPGMRMKLVDADDSEKDGTGRDVASPLAVIARALVIVRDMIDADLEHGRLPEARAHAANALLAPIAKVLGFPGDTE